MANNKLRLFVDTSFWKGLIDSNDTFHSKAKNIFGSNLPIIKELITTDYVFAETVTLLQSRYGPGHRVARLWGKQILNDKRVNVIKSDKSHFKKTWEMFNRYHDKDFSFVDCNSFVIMNSLKITKVLTFDHHFQQVGFVILNQ